MALENPSWGYTRIQGLDAARGARIWNRTTKGTVHKKLAESLRTPPFLLEHYDIRTKVIRTATASERPSVGPGRARD
jgi:hypothetical protein